MHSVITPQPHYIPGYTGHCPRFQYRIGDTYGHLTHRLLVEPCTNHGKQLVIEQTNKFKHNLSPTKNEINTLKARERFVDSAYRDPIIPGYDGFVPKKTDEVGKRFRAAATSGVHEHEAEMERLRCQSRHLRHNELLDRGQGLFNPKDGERLIPKTVFHAPLIPVKRTSGVSTNDSCSDKAKPAPYSKFTIPHFMENDDKEKWIVSGYNGHIPFSKFRHGQTMKELNHSALSDFSNNYQKRLRDTWCTEGQSAGVGNSTCPSSVDYAIYNYDLGSIPNYAGHVPGHMFKVGLTFARSTANAKGWLREHRNKSYYDDF